jgi:hypothetical protein
VLHNGGGDSLARFNVKHEEFIQLNETPELWEKKKELPFRESYGIL